MRRLACAGGALLVGAARAIGESLLLALEAASGACWLCDGSGLEFAGWSAETGVRKRSCGRCGATGKATSQKAGRAA